MQDDKTNGDEAMQRFEDLGRKLFQKKKADDETEEITEGECDPEEPTPDE